MATHLDAIFENGVFRPLKPVDLPENMRVKITIDEELDAGLPGPDQAHFVLPPDRWQAFCDALDAPPKEIAPLRRLLTEPSVLDDQRPTAH
jgi:hypothetical protein